MRDAANKPEIKIELRIVIILLQANSMNGPMWELQWTR